MLAVYFCVYKFCNFARGDWTPVRSGFSRLAVLLNVGFCGLGERVGQILYT